MSFTYVHILIPILTYTFFRQYERAIRTYDGDDPLFPRLEYIKWLEQIYILVGPKSNLLLLVEETVQTFKNDPKYKQDPRFIQILINYVNIYFLLVL